VSADRRTVLQRSYDKGDHYPLLRQKPIRRARKEKGTERHMGRRSSRVVNTGERVGERKLGARERECELVHNTEGRGGNGR